MLMARGAALGFPLLLFLALWLGAASPAQAVQINCSDPPYNGVIDGNLYPFPDNIKLDVDCTIGNCPGGMSTNFTVDNNDPTPYFVSFDNVPHTGQMSCNSVAGHVIWLVNGWSTSIQEGCQNYLIPVDRIDERNPASQTATAIGVPSKYTVTRAFYNTGSPFTFGSSSIVPTGEQIILEITAVLDDPSANSPSMPFVNTAKWDFGTYEIATQ